MKARLNVYRTLLEDSFVAVEMIFEGRPQAGDRIIVPAGSYDPEKDVTVQIAAFAPLWRIDEDGAAVPEYKAQLMKD